MAIEIVAVPNGDDVVLAWRTGKVAGCLGYAVERQPKGGSAQYIETELPFQGQPKPATGERRPSTVWPIQRFVWTDHVAPTETQIRYRVRAVKGTWDKPKAVAASEASKWTPWVTCATESTPGYHLYPNRGIVASPWVERQMEELKKAASDPNTSEAKLLQAAISTPRTPLRERLAGQVLSAIRAQFAKAASAGEELHVALYELRDRELTDLLCATGARAHVILANGAFDSKDPDPNSSAAKDLKAAGVDLQRRMVKPGHYAHNKFIVFGEPGHGRVWTGSTNWTPSGLCTQANHGVLVDDPDLADAYLGYWGRLHDAKSGYPKQLKAGDSQPGQATANGTVSTRAWFTPVPAQADLTDARALIRGAQEGALFLMFRPGDTDTLIDDIKALHGQGRFIRGVVNQGFLGPNSAPAIEFFNKSAKADHGDPELLLPDRLKGPVGPFDTEPAVQGVLIHSKTVVLDPFGDHPVVITGSHNLGTKASGKNDDNLLIVEGAPGLAREFAVYIMNVYDQYRWRYEKGLREKVPAPAPAKPKGKATSNHWDGLQTTAAWQNDSYLKKSAVEVAFWFGGRA
jgi:phosphatidylserine/phosphatidylglycerophosphate/cardiolipin synthase-like enzyme